MLFPLGGTASYRKRCTHCWCNMELHVLLSKEEKERQKGKGGSFKYTWQPPGLELEKVNSINKIKVIVLHLL